MAVFHKSGLMHQIVGQNVGETDERLYFFLECFYFLLLETYFEENIRLKSFLERLQQANKQIFLITNSAYWYVNHGMSYLLGQDWRNFFDVIICQARKPSFFGAEKRFFFVSIKISVERRRPFIL